MGRSRGGSRPSASRGGGGLFGRKPAAPPTRAPPARAMSTNRSPPPPANKTSAPPPAAPAASGGGGMMSGLMGTVAQGMAFGTGSAIAHQAVGAAVGAMSGGSDSGGHAEQAPPQQQQQMQQDPCAWDTQSFNQCIQSNGGNIAPCQELFDALRMCQQTGQSQAQSY